MNLTLFGGFQLSDDAGRAVDISARKSKALLTWLALHPDTNQPRDRLALLLWEDSDTGQARHSLRQALSGLRKGLGAHAAALVTTQENVLLEGGRIRVDALRFDTLLDGPHSSETLNEAVSIYGGELLEGFNPRSNTFEEWLMTQRSHYRERALGAMGELLTHHLEAHQLEAGVRLAIQMLSGDPLQEQVHRALMQIYARLNRPADALRQYRRCRRVLFRELGLAPEPATDSLYREIARARTLPDGEAHAPGPGAVPAPGNLPATGVSSPEAGSRESASRELRPVTVAHLNLGHYADLVAERDPERLHQQTRDLADEVEELARRYGGQMHHQHNDAIVVLFGLPAAHGNECEKAVRAALELGDRLGAETGSRSGVFGLRIGIVSGSVIRDGGGPVSGAVFARAEQLARAAAPGEVVLSDAAYHGLRLPVEATRRDDSAWQIQRVRPQSAPGARATGFVGRERELRQFDAALEASIDGGNGETFLVRGEAGIGKTRLVDEMAERAGRLGVACHHALVLDFGTESRAEPIPALLRQLLGVEETAAADELEARTRECLGDQWHQGLHHQALHALFRLPLAGPESEQGEQLPGEALEIGSRQILDRILDTASREQPCLLIVEDIHWAGQHTLAVLAELAFAVSRCPALLIITSRVEGEPLDPGWRSAMHGAPLTTLDLGPLRQEQALTLAEQLTDAEPDFIQRCIDRSGGNPFFLEQLLWGTTRREETVPDSVQSLVLTRLDMLSGGDRMAAQAASILGQRFALDALRHLLDDGDYRPDALLNQRLIRPKGGNFLFGHALLREGVRDSLPASRRQALHLGAAAWYRDRDPALHARHLDLAGDGRAADACLRAAQLAIPAFDFSQALDLASRGAEIAREPGLITRLNGLRGELLFQKGMIDEARDAFEAAANSAADDHTRCRALIGVASALTVQDELDRALEVLDQATPLAWQCRSDALQTELHYRRGDILFALGRAEECLIAHQLAEKLARQSKAPLLEIRALAGLADAHYAAGRMHTAGRYFDRCIELARRNRRLPQELGNLAMRSLTRFYCGAAGDAVADARECARLAAGHGNLRAEMMAYINLALIRLYTDDVDGAEHAARRGLELAHQLGASRFFGDALASIGEALALRGQVEKGVGYLERAYQAALDSVPTHTGPFILGVLARITPDGEQRRRAIAEGQRFLDQGSLSHNYLHFYQNLIEVCLDQGDPEGALHSAAALEAYTRDEPLDWSNFYIARGRLLADTLNRGIGESHRQQARRLLDRANAAGLRFGTLELEALAGP